MPTYHSKICASYKPPDAYATTYKCRRYVPSILPKRIRKYLDYDCHRISLSLSGKVFSAGLKSVSPPHYLDGKLLAGLEPTTWGLQNRCSTIELQKQMSAQTFRNCTAIRDVFRVREVIPLRVRGYHGFTVI